jgi:hypothetical protein
MTRKLDDKKCETCACKELTEGCLGCGSWNGYEKHRPVKITSGASLS